MIPGSILTYMVSIISLTRDVDITCPPVWQIIQILSIWIWIIPYYLIGKSINITCLIIPSKQFPHHDFICLSVYS